jgi:multicomponent Na+:H+ antiporter subunit E
MRVVAVATWCYLVWVALSWTATVEFAVAGLLVSLAVGLALSPLGHLPGPWTLLRPRRAAAVLALGTWVLVDSTASSLRLAARIWTPRRPLASGMVIVPTRARTDAELAAVGILTSLVVDSQLVDLARADDELQFHVLQAPAGGAEDARRAINGPVERLLLGALGRREEST